MAIDYKAATYISASSFSMDAATAEPLVLGVRVLCNCGADGIKTGSVVSNTTGTVVVSLDSGSLTSNLTGVAWGNDSPDSLPRATDSVYGAVKTGVTVKGLITSSTTIYVATTGSDTTGTGLVGAPYASISKALASIAGKQIASGVTVTIQVADGTYALSSAIVIDHPDADKISVLGNQSAFVDVAVSTVDTTNKIISIPGNYSASLSSGRIFALIGSSTSGLNGCYKVASVSWDGTNTNVTTVGAIASSTVGGASLRVIAWNACVLSVANGARCLEVNAGKNLYQFAGFRITAAGTSDIGIVTWANSSLQFANNLIIEGFTNGAWATYKSFLNMQGVSIYGGSYGLRAQEGAYIRYGTTSQISNMTTACMQAGNGGRIRAYSVGLSQNANSNAPSPAFGTYSADDGYIWNS